MDLLLLVAGRHTRYLASARRWGRTRAADPWGAGVLACESADRKSLLFQPKDADSPLMTMALAGGQARQLIECVKNSAFGVGSRGVYYVPCDSTPDPPLYVLDQKTGRNARLGRLDGLAERPLGLSISPDGTTVIYPRQALLRADLMLIENFR